MSNDAEPNLESTDEAGMDSPLKPTFQDRLNYALHSGQSLIMTETAEWERLDGRILDAIDYEHEALSDEGNPRWFFKHSEIRKLQVWTSQGWSSEHEIVKKVRNEPWPKIVMWFRDTLDQPGVLLMDDRHPGVLEVGEQSGQRKQDRDAAMWLLRDFVRLKAPGQNSAANSHRKTLIVAGPHLNEVREIKHEMLRLDLPHPDEEELDMLRSDVAEKWELQGEQRGGNNSDLLKAALGLTIMEAETAFNLAIAETGGMGEEAVRKVMEHKKEVIRGMGALEYIDDEIPLDQIGGLDVLKDWLMLRKDSYSAAAVERGLSSPKGVLMVGLPGCGKSLTAKAVGSAWKRPLIRLDLGSVFQGQVGSSEKNIRNALRLAEAVSPCVLWIDEIEKGMAGGGTGGSGNLDSGVGKRVFGTILTWMQEQEGVFLVATANNVLELDAALLRKGRFDEIFFVGYPRKDVREQIFRIHLLKNDELTPDINLAGLADRTDGWSGAEIEAAVREAQFYAFADGNRDITQDDLYHCISQITPQSESMDKLQDMIEEGTRVGIDASSPEVPSGPSGGQRRF